MYINHDIFLNLCIKTEEKKNHTGDNDVGLNVLGCQADILGTNHTGLQCSVIMVWYWDASVKASPQGKEL